MREWENQDSKHVILVHSKKKIRIIVHNPGALAKPIDGMMLKWKILQVIPKIR